MEILLNILNESGYNVDKEKGQIIDIANNEVGAITIDKNLEVYNFSDGRKVIFDRISNQFSIDISNGLTILYKFISKPSFSKFSKEVDQINEFYINLNMKLSNGTTCRLECYHNQHSSCITDYEVRFYHRNIKYDKSISFSRISSDPNYITYNNENGLIDYTSIFDPALYSIEGISQEVKGNFLRPLIMDSDIVDDDEKVEIINSINNGLSIINDSLNELIKLFLTYDFSPKNELPCGKSHKTYF